MRARPEISKVRVRVVQRVERWRARAEKLRTVANTSQAEQTRILLLDAAEAYEQMIERAEKAAAKLTDA
jgi:hypothetical protein